MESISTPFFCAKKSKSLASDTASCVIRIPKQERCCFMKRDKQSHSGSIYDRWRTGQKNEKHCSYLAVLP